ncbi:FtsX-like permease family protein [Allobacillus sp. GCM10007491]|uniref:ABC transporter permease n=1 Tax=Allobacillus saliphilus TaxID=2912308 RepID=A0A941CX60_9BACI|nr:ABC transporter permease [Allobacillus saliphilus]MBR7553770.1 ABC transporter permease [Allobacillus saliphilus]
MNVNQLIYRNLKNNLKNYYLYVFALIFSISIYFAFVTLQYDASMDPATGTIKGQAAVRAGTIVLILIVGVFLIYANNLFIKRRSNEIALFQLIGMTKGKVFRLLTIENLILYLVSLAIGIGVGFSISKLMVMIVYKLTDVTDIATMHFSTEALSQTLIVFGVIYLFIMLVNSLFIKKENILSLFTIQQSAEIKVKKLSIIQVLLGLLGIGLIIAGYVVSQQLFSGNFTTVNELFSAMGFILMAVIFGTYLFYKGSVTFVLQLIRKSHKGYLSINQVLSLSSVMFRMKSNALLLTIITTVSALAIGLLSLSYISYYSAEKQAENFVINDFSLVNEESYKQFTSILEENNIDYQVNQIEVFNVELDASQIMDFNFEEDSSVTMNPSELQLPIISDESIEGIDVDENHFLLSGYSDFLQRFMSFKNSGKATIKTENDEFSMKFLGLNREYYVSSYFTNGGGMPIAIVDEEKYQQLKVDLDPELQHRSQDAGAITFRGVDVSERDIEKANELFLTEEIDRWAGNDSQQNMARNQKMNMGLIMFIVGFLGLTFLVTSGCILYFKQMDESEIEKPSYTILRKLGFTQRDLIKGIQLKQSFNFGIPLFVGLLHSYFAVQSGWFFFGTEVWTPMLIVMSLYAVLYSLFGLLSVLYYKKIIQEAL